MGKNGFTETYDREALRRMILRRAAGKQASASVCKRLQGYARGRGAFFLGKKIGLRPVSAIKIGRAFRSESLTPKTAVGGMSLIQLFTAITVVMFVEISRQS